MLAKATEKAAAARALAAKGATLGAGLAAELSAEAKIKATAVKAAADIKAQEVRHAHRQQVYACQHNTQRHTQGQVGDHAYSRCPLPAPGARIR